MNIVQRRTIRNWAECIIDSLDCFDEVGEDTLRSEIGALIDCAVRYMPNLEENLAAIGLFKEAEPEPGQRIWAGNCPSCSASLDVQYGEDEGEIGVVWSPKNEATGEKPWYEDEDFVHWVRGTHYTGVSGQDWAKMVRTGTGGNPTPLWASYWRECELMYTSWSAGCFRGSVK